MTHVRLFFIIVKNNFLIEKVKGTEVALWRSHHSAEIAGLFMIVYGGISSLDNEYLHNVIVLELRQLKWMEIKVSYSKEIGIAYHSSALVVAKEKLTSQRFHIFSLPEEKIKSRIKYEGMYVFGGIEYTKKSGFSHTNEIKILRFGVKPLQWIYPTIKCKSPEPRCKSTLNFNETFSLLIIHGGTNGIHMFNDFWILDLIYFNWCKVELLARIPSNRCGHRSIIKGDYIFIFGGSHNEKYASPDVLEVNIDIFKNEIREEKLKKSDNKSNVNNLSKYDFIKMLADKIINNIPVDINNELKFFLNSSKLNETQKNKYMSINTDLNKSQSQSQNNDPNQDRVKKKKINSQQNSQNVSEVLIKKTENENENVNMIENNNNILKEDEEVEISKQKEILKIIN